MTQPTSTPRAIIRNFTIVAAVLAVVLLVIFGAGILPGHVLFSNDGPLGAISAGPFKLPELFTGAWFDLNTLGYQVGGAPNISYGLQWLLGPVMFAKLFAPISLFLLGVCAWAFFRQLKLAPAACVLGALAASLNSGFLSTAAWGMAPHTMALAMSFLALSLLVDTSSNKRWLKVPLAGLAVGMGVSEGADVGAIFSLLVACFVMYQAMAAQGIRQVIAGAARVSVVAIFAAFIAAQTIVVLVSTQISGVAGAQQDNKSKEERWDWATQWSLPKREGLNFIIPGVFGYRMDTPEGGNYWGAVGRDPSWDRYFASGKQGPPPQGFMRFTGGGVYAGILVALIGFWAMLQGFRKDQSIYALESRRWVWFWSALLVIALLLAFGRFAPFYQILYALPYFSTIRNPAKFGHVVNWALVILFAYGLNGLWTRYLSPNGSLVRKPLGAWWQAVRGFDRNWTHGCIIALGLSVVGWLIYASSRNEMVNYLQEVRFDPTMAKDIAAFSARQLGVWVLFFAGAIILVTLILSGRFTGQNAKWGAVLLGLFIVIDLGRANQPWIIAWNYKQKYASNPILDQLRDKAYLQRTAILPSWLHQAVRAPAEWQILDQLYRIEWAQHHFYYYNIPALDIVQLPRMPEDLLAFETVMQPRQQADIAHLIARKWQLTSTRYLLGAADYVPFLNQQIDPALQRFRVAERFNIGPKPGIARPEKLEELTADPATNGVFALIEFTGALPRAGLYSNWIVNTNQQAALEQLANPAFDPATTVILPEEPTGGMKPAGTNSNAGKVEFLTYTPKRFTLVATASTNAVLLMTDRYDANWRVTIDGKSAPLMKANYLMRGVMVPAGEHTIEFSFEPPVKPLYVSASAWGVGLLLLIALTLTRNRPTPESDPTRSATPK